MADTQLILEVLNKVHDSQKEMRERVDKVLEDHEDRIRSNERTITKFKTLGSAVVALAGFFGWDSMRHHISILK